MPPPFDLPPSCSSTARSSGLEERDHALQGLQPGRTGLAQAGREALQLVALEELLTDVLVREALELGEDLLPGLALALPGDPGVPAPREGGVGEQNLEGLGPARRLLG